MTSTTHAQEYTAHCRAVLEVLKAAEVPTWTPQESHVSAIRVCVLPALRALKIRGRGREKFRAWLAAGALDSQATYVNPQGEAFLVVPLGDLLPLLHHSRHPVGCAYAVWACNVEMALTVHGCYAPERQHTPLPGEGPWLALLRYEARCHRCLALSPP